MTRLHKHKRILVFGPGFFFFFFVIFHFFIPYSADEGQVESLNAGVAGALVMYEALRQKRAKNGRR